MGEIPVKIIINGDRVLGSAYIRRAKSVMAMLENFMSFRQLKQGVLRRQLAPGVFVKCDRRFGLRTAEITVAPQGAPEITRRIIECFANATCALAYVLEVVGVTPTEPGEECRPEPVCATCIKPGFYPLNYYCTRGIRYHVAVCDGKGEYLLFKNIPSTDYTPWCPEEQVIVMMNRTNDLPVPVLDRANTSPRSRHAFTRDCVPFDECLSILPFLVRMPRRYEVET